MAIEHDTVARLAAALCGVLALAACTSPTPDENRADSPAPETADPRITVTATLEPTPSPELPESPLPSPDTSPQAQDPSTAFVTLASVADGEVFVGGYVEDVMEDGGQCTFTISRDDEEVMSLTRVGAENRGSTSCGSDAFAASRLDAGRYDVTLTYSSPSGSAHSEPVLLVVP